MKKYKYVKAWAIVVTPDDKLRKPYMLEAIWFKKKDAEHELQPFRSDYTEKIIRVLIVQIAKKRKKK